MFQKGSSSIEYNPLSLDEFSDDDSLSDGESAPNRNTKGNGNGNSNSNSSKHPRNTANGQRHPVNDASSNYTDTATSGPTSNGAADDRRQQHELLQRQQDAGLELLGQHAERLGIMSLQISDELGFQNGILNDMDENLDEANANLDLVTRKTKEFIRASGGTRNCIVIATLVGITILLILLILYT